MNKIFSKFTLVLIIAFTVVSCNSKQSLQKFFVDNQNNDNFIVLDVPSSTLLNLSSEMTEEDKKTVESFRKINVLALQNEKDKNKDLYATSKSTLKSIFKDDKKYIPLIQSNSKYGSFDVYYEGTDDAIDEVIVFGYAEDKGLLVARVIGDHMDIGKISKVVNKIKPNKEGFSSLTSLFGNSFNTK